MKKEYLVTGKMSDGNDYRHTVIATNKYKAIEQALTSIFNHAHRRLR